MRKIRCLAAPGRETEGEGSGMKDMTLGCYQVRFADGGIRVLKNGETLYFNARPVYVSVKTYGAISIWRHAAIPITGCGC